MKYIWTLVLILTTTSLVDVSFNEAQAEEVAFEVRGSVIGFDGPQLPPFEIGQEYIATYIFDSEATGTPVFGGGKDYFGAVIAANYRIGAYTGSSEDPVATNIRVLNDHFGHTDEYSATLSDISAPPIQTPFGLIAPSELWLVYLHDSGTAMNPPDALNSDELPLTPPDITLFDSAAWVLVIEEPGIFFARVRGVVTSLTQIPLIKNVLIEILPIRDVNVINLKKKGSIKVTILSTNNFLAFNEVAPDTVEFGAAGAGVTRHKTKDVNHDGLPDMVFYFNINDAGIECGDTEATLVGETYDGTAFEGTDMIVTKGCG